MAGDIGEMGEEIRGKGGGIGERLEEKWTVIERTGLQVREGKGTGSELGRWEVFHDEQI